MRKEFEAEVNINTRDKLIDKCLSSVNEHWHELFINPNESLNKATHKGDKTTLIETRNRP